MDQLETICRSRSSDKDLWRAAYVPSSREVQPNLGRQQMVGKEDWVSAVAVFFSPEDYRIILRELATWVIVREKPEQTTWIMEHSTYIADIGEFEMIRSILKVDPLVLRGFVNGRGQSQVYVGVFPRGRAQILWNPPQDKDFIDKAIDVEISDSTDAALDLIYDEIDSSFKASRFDEIDRLLATKNPDTLSVDLILGVLTATLPARSKLPSRKSFFVRAQDTLLKRAEWSDDLLVGLAS